MRRQTRANPERCAHPSTMTVTSAGLDRVVCEGCGQVNVSYRSGLSGLIDRTKFARPADDQPAPDPGLPNALVKHLTRAPDGATLK